MTQAAEREPIDPSHRLTPVVRVAPAKLNLTLAVIGPRPDGYHDLHSVMVPLGLADRLSLAPAGGREDTLHVDGFATGAGRDDLVLRALAETRSVVGAGWSGASGPPPPLAALLDKRVPVAAGLAGGSSDAAAAVDGALESWGAVLSIHDRLRVAARLGSDVPFFLAGGAALVEGRGELVTPLRGIVDGSPGVLIVTPPIGISTSAVFEARDAGARQAAGAAFLSSVHLAEELRPGLDVRTFVDRAGVLAAANDLVPATASVAPELVGVRRALGRLLGRPVGQSGSGPTLWVLYPSLAEAAAERENVMTAAGDGRLPIPNGQPFVAATTILSAAPLERSAR